MNNFSLYSKPPPVAIPPTFSYLILPRTILGAPHRRVAPRQSNFNSCIASLAQSS